MKILVVGGTHGDERTGVEIVDFLERHKDMKVDVLLANPRAVKQCHRFIETDLNRSFGVVSPTSYEERRAVEIAKILGQYDLILEFHNTVSKTTCVILTNQEPSAVQLGIASYFGFEHVVIMPSGGRSMSSRNPQKTISFEISTQQTQGYSVTHFISKIKALESELWKLQTSKKNAIQIHHCLKRKVTKAELSTLRMGIDEFVDFVPFSSRQSELLGLVGVFAPLFVGESAYGENFAFNVVEIDRSLIGESTGGHKDDTSV